MQGLGFLKFEVIVENSGLQGFGVLGFGFGV